MNGLVRKIGAGAFAAALIVSPAGAQSSAIDGEVKKIDQGAGKITLKHGPAKSIGMDEPMTMVYRVKDPAMLNQVNRRQSPVRSGER